MTKFSRFAVTAVLGAVLAACVAGFATPAHAQGSPQFHPLRNVHWITSVGQTTTIGGFADSTQLSLGAAIDTSRGFSTVDLWPINPANGVVGTAGALFRGFIVSPNTTASLDTLDFFVDGSVTDSGPWVQCLAKTAVVIQGSTDKIIPFVVTSKFDGTTYGTPWLWPYLRIRAQEVTGTFKAASLYLYYPANSLAAPSNP